MKNLLKMKFPQLVICFYLVVIGSMLCGLIMPAGEIDASQIGNPTPPSDFTLYSVGSQSVGAGKTNVPVMSFRLPTTKAGAASITSDIIENSTNPAACGSAPCVSFGASIASFGVNDYFSDIDNNNLFSGQYTFFPAVINEAIVTDTVPAPAVPAPLYPNPLLPRAALAAGQLDYSDQVIYAGHVANLNPVSNLVWTPPNPANPQNLKYVFNYITYLGAVPPPMLPIPGIAPFSIIDDIDNSNTLSAGDVLIDDLGGVGPALLPANPALGYSHLGIFSGAEPIIPLAFPLFITLGGDYYVDDNSNNMYDFDELLWFDLTYGSPDGNLAAGELSPYYQGRSTTALVNINAKDPDLKYYDTPAVGGGIEDIIRDFDQSTYYYGDELNQITIANTSGTCTDSDIAGLYVYLDDGNGTFDGSGTDTLVGSDTTGPLFWNQAITGAPLIGFATSSPTLRLFVAVNIAASPTDGCTINPEIVKDGLVFTSNNDGPTDNPLVSADTITVDTTPPAISQLQIGDNNSDGLIDQIILVFDGPYVVYTYDYPTETPVSAYLGTITLPDGSIADLSSATMGGVGSGNQITINNISGQATINTAAGATDIDGLTGLWKDAAGNLITDSGDDSETVVDVADPLIIARETADTDGDGYIDRLNVKASEPLSNFIGAWPAQLTLDVVGYNGDTPVDSTLFDDNFYIDFTEGASYDTSAKPNLNLVDNVGAMADLGVAHNLVANSNVASTDKAKPALVSLTSTTADGAYGVGSNINVTAVYSETLSLTSSLTVDLNNTVTGVVIPSPATTNVVNDSLYGTYTVGAGEDTADLTVNTITAENVLDLIPNIQTGKIIPAGHNLGDNKAIVIDTTGPTVVNVYSLDLDHDGDVESMDIEFSSAVDDSSFTASGFTLDNDTTNSTGNEEVASGGSTGVNNVWTGAVNVVDDQYYRVTLTNGIPGTDRAYLHVTSPSITDVVGNQLVTGDNVSVWNADCAQPLILSTTPANNATGVTLSQNIIVNFSEEMHPGPTALTVVAGPDPGGWVQTITGNVGTYTHGNFINNTSYTVQIGGADLAGNALIAGTAPNPWSFSTQTSGGGTTVPGGGGGGGGGGAGTPPPSQPPVDQPSLILQDPAPAGPLPSGVQVGQLVKLATSTAVYFIDQDNRRHAFPDVNTYYSWFPNFDGVKVISLETMSAIPLGSNVVMRPGTFLIKIKSLPYVYAVEAYGVIRWLKTEEIARALYGADWAKRIVDVSDAFFINYQVGSDITSAIHPTGSLIQYASESSIYYIENGLKRYVEAGIFTANLYQSRFLIPGVSSTLVYPDGALMTAMPIEDLMKLR